MILTSRSLAGRGLLAALALSMSVAPVAGCASKAAVRASAAPSAEKPTTRVASDAGLVWNACPDILPAGCEIAVLHGDPTRENADIFLRVPGGYVLTAHSHSSGERMVLVSGRLHLRYLGAEPFTMVPGDYAYGPPGLPHVGNCEGKEPCTLFIAFEGPIDAAPFSGAIE